MEIDLDELFSTVEPGKVYRKSARQKEKERIFGKSKQRIRPDIERQARREKALMEKYKITIAEFDRLLISQKGTCAICKGTDPGRRGWNLDHCHKTGWHRGILCHCCNIMLGFARDKPEVLESAAAYLRRSVE